MNGIKKLLNGFCGKPYDLCYEILTQYGESAEIFEFVCKNYALREKNNDIEISSYFSSTEIEEYESIYGDAVNGLLNSNIKKCNIGIIKPEEFYITLWNALCSNFSGLKERAFAFYYIVIDTSIPYMYIGKPISMSNERYRELINRNENSLEKINYIIKSGYNQHSERASLLLNCLDEIEDFESKVVVLAQAIKIFNKGRNLSSSVSIEDLIKQIDKKIEELEREE